jgi:catechol 2,3-dioxygenase-like lactoylglutathione lyase family enzyme
MAISLSPDLIVTDLDRSVRFYTRALGLAEEDRATGPEGAFFAMLARDGLRLMLETPKSPDPGTRGLIERHGGRPGATINLYVSVDDLAAEKSRLARADVKFEGPVDKPYGMREVSFTDPDGYCWTLGEKVRG